MQKVRGGAMAAVVTTLAVPLFVTGCSIPIRAGANFQPGYDFEPYTSFAWDEPMERPAGDPRLDGSPFFEQRLHAAVHWELSTRGIDLVGDGHDETESGGLSQTLAVHHHTSVADHVEVYGADYLGATSDYGDETQVIQYAEAMFILGLADAGTREIVWRAWAQVNVEKALENPTVMRSLIDAAVAKMFENFPVPPREAAPGSTR